jgi:hypothetical protein
VRTVTVTDPEGSTWRVRVVWQPRWRALARRYGGWRRKRRAGDLDVSDLANPPRGGGGRGGGGSSFIPDLGDDLLVALAVIAGLIVFGLLFWWLLLPLLLLVLDLVVVVVLAVLAIAGRVLFRRPWTVAAERDDERYVTEVVGWRHALHTRDDMAEKLRLGYPARQVGTLR